MPRAKSDMFRGMKVTPELRLKLAEHYERAVSSESFRKRLNAQPSLRKSYQEAFLRSTQTSSLFRPQDHQLGFFTSRAYNRLLIGSNQSGKTLCGLVDLVWRIRGEHPFDKEWNKRVRKQGVRALIYAREEKNICEIFGPKLIYQGELEMIPDADTGLYRLFEPWNPQDLARKDDVLPAPPMIPDDWLEGGERGVVWENKGKGVFSKIKFKPLFDQKKGSEIMVLTAGANAQPLPGTQVDIIIFDEELFNAERFYWESVPRLVKRGGIFMWLATPQTGSMLLQDLYEKAKEDPPPQVGGRREFEAFEIDTASNKFLSEDAKEMMKSALAMNEEQYKIRWEGKFATESHRVFHEFTPLIHDLDLEKHPDLFPGRPGFRQIPADWTRYVGIDPGHSVAAALFAAVSPQGSAWEEEHGPTVVLYDEIYLRKASAKTFAQTMQDRCKFQVMQDFVIDAHGARLTDIGSGRNVLSQYMEQFEEHDVFCQRRRNGFAWGSDDVAGRVSSARQMLRVRPEFNTSVLRVVAGRLPSFRRELARYTRQINSEGELLDLPDDVRCGGRNHLMHCFQYLAAFWNTKPTGMPWVPVRPTLPVDDHSPSAFYGQLSGNRIADLVPAPQSPKGLPHGTMQEALAAAHRMRGRGAPIVIGVPELAARSTSSYL